MTQRATPRVARLSAFTDTPEGGNPAGVVTDARGIDVGEMQAIAADVGYSETAFLSPVTGKPGEYAVRYFTPSVEVDFCGHATIAAGVALAREAERPVSYIFHTKAGTISLEVTETPVGLAATLTSPPTHVRPLRDDLLSELLEALEWEWDDLDMRFMPAVGWSGNAHPVLVAGSRHRLHRLDYDFDALASLCQREKWTTIQLVWPDDADPMLRRWFSRNPAPGVGIDEDPATGSAAVALGAYLVSTGTVAPGDVLTVLQGDDMGRPSVLLVTVGSSSMLVTGTAVDL